MAEAVLAPCILRAMRVHHAVGHAQHAPGRFLARGEFKPCPESPRRADVLLDAVAAAGHPVSEAPVAPAEAIARAQKD